VPDDFSFLVKAPERCTLAVFPHHTGAEDHVWQRSLGLLPGHATLAGVDDHTVADPHVGLVGRRAGAVDDRSSSDQQVPRHRA